MTDIRPATRDDAWALAELRWEFRAGRAPAVESRNEFLARCAGWMRRELAAQDPWRAWLAFRQGSGQADDNRIVGQVWLDTLPKIPNPVGERERHAYLSNLYVTPAERGGIGVRLLEAAVAWSRENGIDRVVLWPTQRSESLYLRHGFRRDGGVMELIC
jgi:GNAT superfamily N-acetyltransferase